jgi:CDP-diacylglycerol---serine O-phosphatidyltransferase
LAVSTGGAQGNVMTLMSTYLLSAGIGKPHTETPKHAPPRSYPRFLGTYSLLPRLVPSSCFAIKPNVWCLENHDPQWTTTIQQLSHRVYSYLYDQRFTEAVTKPVIRCRSFTVIVFSPVPVQTRDVAMPESRNKQRLSMLRSYTVAYLFTLGNASSGTVAIFLCLNYIAEGRNRIFWIAFVLHFVALACDVIDGYWARRSRRRSILGADLDSLADIVSFGVAPAVLGFTLGMRGGWDMAILAYFVVCGISRLARFNVTAVALSDSTTGKVKYFEGTPIPTSILIVLLLGVAFSQQAIENDLWFGVLRLGPAMLHPLTLLYAASGTAMISTFRIPKP